MMMILVSELRVLWCGRMWCGVVYVRRDWCTAKELWYYTLYEEERRTEDEPCVLLVLPQDSGFGIWIGAKIPRR